MLVLEGVSKSYIQGDKKIVVLLGCSLSVLSGEFVAIMGDSGSGKSTLLNLISGIDFVDSGKIWLSKRRLDNMQDSELTLFRRDNIGIVFQFFNLIPALEALDNVALPLLLRGVSYKKAIMRSSYLLDLVGLSARRKSMPSELSGGEMQRVSLARALSASPKLILADEPTGNLDGATSKEVVDLLKDLSKRENTTVLFVTHNRDLVINSCDNLFNLRDGKLFAG